MSSAAIIPLPSPVRFELDPQRAVNLLAMRTPYPTPANATHWHDAEGRPYVDAPAFVCELPNGARMEVWVEPQPGPDGTRQMLLTRSPGQLPEFGAPLSAQQIDALTDLYRRVLQPDAPAQQIPSA